MCRKDAHVHLIKFVLCMYNVAYIIMYYIHMTSLIFQYVVLYNQPCMIRIRLHSHSLCKLYAAEIIVKGSY